MLMGLLKRQAKAICNVVEEIQWFPMFWQDGRSSFVLEVELPLAASCTYLGTCSLANFDTI